MESAKNDDHQSIQHKHKENARAWSDPITTHARIVEEIILIRVRIVRQKPTQKEKTTTRRVLRSLCAKESELQKGIVESKHVLPVESRNRLLHPLLQLRHIWVPHFSRQGVDLLCLIQFFGPCSSRSLFSKPDGRRKWIHDEWWGGGGSWQYGRGTWGLQRTRWPKQNHPFLWEKKLLLLSNTWIKQQASLFDPRTSITRQLSNNEPPCSIRDIVHWAMDLCFKLIFSGSPFSPYFAAIFWEHALTCLFECQFCLCCLYRSDYG